jgi:hypothetical protein
MASFRAEDIKITPFDPLDKMPVPTGGGGNFISPLFARIVTFLYPIKITKLLKANWRKRLSPAMGVI